MKEGTVQGRRVRTKAGEIVEDEPLCVKVRRILIDFFPANRGVYEIVTAMRVAKRLDYSWPQSLICDTFRGDDGEWLKRELADVGIKLTLRREEVLMEDMGE